ncbi:GDSL-type esterase/lipase family protein [Metamycoplasma canadense]|uniref:Uncharacterized protein n=1 Tax=Metamycoplasma canadense TaxID=29554 RepID=A0A077L999_9BACT|nr:GDSL-type esterase/lipase family protein [Metamycoplasma canadense]BAP39608.1 hypothetical protein MCAN360_0471 [Metamycoplasma canadense]
MKINKLVKKISKISAALALSITFPTLSISCGNKGKDPYKKPDIDLLKPQEQKPVSGKINYIAIGDDYATGNNNSDNSKNRNYFDKNTNEVYGTSYASYLANSIRLINDEKTTLENYENLGLSFSTSSNWLHLLNPEQFKSTKSFEQIIRLNKELETYNPRLNSYENLIEKIKKSNLMTISLGFNDIFKKSEILGLNLREFLTDEERNNLISNYEKKISIRLYNLKKNYEAIIDRIKSINPNININLTGFIPPLLHSIQINHSQIINLLKNTTARLNQIIQDVANNKKVNYYNIEDKNYILNNANKFSTDFLSILPNNNSYKKLAQDIFSKMSISNDEYQLIFNKKSNEYQKENKHNIAIEFNKKGTTIKSLIFGIIGSDLDTYKKPYPFESITKNKEIIRSEEKNTFTQKILLELKINLSNIDITNANEIKFFTDNLFSILGIDIPEIKKWFFDLIDKLHSVKQTKILIEFLNQILLSKFTDNLLNKANLKISETIAKKSHKNISFEEIKKIFKDEFRNKESIYQIFKSVLNNIYLSNNENKQFIKNNLQSLTKLIFSKEVVKKIFPNKLINLWNKASTNEVVNKKIDLLINKIIDNLLLNYNSYFKNTHFEGFINAIFKDSKKETIELFSSIIDWLKNNKPIFDETLNNLVNDIKIIYAIPNNQIENIKYFLKNTIENLKNFKYFYELLDLFVETILDIPKTNSEFKTQQILKAFVDGLILNTKDANTNNKVFFSLISTIPKNNNLNLEKYDNGMKYLGLGLIKVQNYFTPERINSLFNEKLRNSLLKFLENISTNKNNELNQRGKDYIKSLFSLLIDDISKDSSLLNQILDKLGTYVAIYPLSNFIKKTKFEKQILQSNPQVKSIEEFIRNGYQNLYKSVNNTIIIGKLKNVIFDIIDNGKEYNKSSAYNFFISFLKRIKENGSIDLVKAIFSQIATQKNSELLVDILATYTNTYLNLQLTQGDRELLIVYIKNFLSSIVNSEIFQYFINNFSEILKKIDTTQIDDFNKLEIYLKNNLNILFNNSKNPKVIQYILDLLSLKNTTVENNFNKFINVISIFLNNEKVIDLIIKKINLKNIISDLSNKINLEKIPKDIHPDLEELLKNTTNNILNKWDSNIEPKIKELIKKLVSNEQVKKSNNLNQLFSLIFSENKEYFKTLIIDLVKSIILSSDENKNKIVNIATYFINGTNNYKNLREEEKTQIKSILKKGIQFIENKKIIDILIDAILNTIEKNINNFGIDFSKYSWSKIFEHINTKNINIIELITEFIINKSNENENLTKDELKTLLKTILINVSNILPLIKNKNVESKENENENADIRRNERKQKNKNSENFLNNALELFKNVLNKLSKQNKEELIPYLVDALYEVKKDNNIKQIIIKELEKIFKTKDQDYINYLSDNKRNPSFELSKIITEKIYNLILSEENKQSIIEILKSIFASEENIELNVDNFVSKILKNINADKFIEFIENIIKNAFEDNNVLVLLSKTAIILIKKQLKVDFDENETKTLLSYLKLLLKSFPNNDLFKEIKQKLFNLLKEKQSFSTLNEFRDKIYETIKELIKIDNHKISKILDLILIKNNQEIKNGETHFLKSLFVLLSKKPILDYLLTKIDLKNLISKSLENIEIKDSTLNENEKQALKDIIFEIKSYTEINFDSLINNNIHELIEKLLLKEVINNTNTFNQWAQKFINVNKNWLKEKINSIFNEFLTLEKAKNLREKVSKFLVEFLAKKLNNLNIEQQQKTTLTDLILKIIEGIEPLGFVEKITNSAVDLLDKNLKEYKLKYNDYNFNGLININEILTNTSEEKINDFIDNLESKHLSTIFIIIIKNFEKIEQLFKTNEQPISHNSKPVNNINNEKNKQIVLFNQNKGIPWNLEKVFRIIKKSFSIMTNKEREEIKKLIPELVKKIKNSQLIKNWLNEKLGFIENKISNQDPTSIEFAKNTKEKIIKIIFENPHAEDFLTKTINYFIDLDKEKLNSINSMNDLFKNILKENKNNIQTFIKESIKEITKDENYIKNLFKFILNLINKQNSFDASSDEIENISSLIQRVIKDFSNKDIVSEVISKLFESIINVEVFDKNGYFDSKNLLNNILSNLKIIDWKTLFSQKNVNDLATSFFEANEANANLEKELISLYDVLARSLPKLNNKTNKKLSQNNSPSTNNQSDEKTKEFLTNIQGTILNILVGLSGTLKTNSNTAKNAIVNVIHKVFKEQIKKINWKSIKQDVIQKDKIQIIVDKFIEKPIIKTLIDDIVTDFLTGEKINNINTIGEVIHKTLQKISEKLKNNVTNVIHEVIKDKELINLIVEDLIKYLKLENTDQNDKNFLSELIIKIVESLIDTDFYKRKVVKRSVDHVVKYSKNFTIFEPLKWLNDAITKIKSGFSFADLKIIGSLIGENKPINGEKLVKLINLLFGKSKLEDSVLYNALRNINMNADKSKRTNIETLINFVNGSIKNLVHSNNNSHSNNNDDPDNITPDLDPLKLMDDIFRMLAGQYNKNPQVKNNSFKIRSKTEEWKAVYRFKVAIDFIIFEFFGRETLINNRDVSRRVINLYTGVRSILWELQEGTNIKAIPGLGSKFSGMQRYFTSERDRRQFTNYSTAETGWLFVKNWEYFNENNYGPESITYIITSSGYNEKERNHLKNFKYKVKENGKENEISKKDYILLTLKEGGYGKFMKLNNKNSSISSWSKLNEVKDGFY